VNDFCAEGRHVAQDNASLVCNVSITVRWLISGWQPDQNGGYVMTVKVGPKRFEFEKGKAAFVVPSLDKLPWVIDTLIKVVRAGEL
jgi:hypothetical protein